MVDDLTRAERHEVERHKYFLSRERGYDVGFEMARNDWLEHHAPAWRRRRQQHMLDMQRQEIQRYKWIASQHAQRDLGREAVLEWIQRYAAEWREWYEREYTRAEDEA